MSELAAILARRRAKDGTGEDAPKEGPSREDYDYESTMKTGVSVPGMSGGIPMVGLTRPGVALPGLASNEPAVLTSAPEPEPAAVSHATLSRATGPKRRAPTKPKAAAISSSDTTTLSIDDDAPLFPTSSDASPSIPVVAAVVVSAPSPKHGAQTTTSELPRRPSIGLFGALPSQPPSTLSGGASSGDTKRPTSGAIPGSSLFGSAVEKRPSGGESSSLFSTPPSPRTAAVSVPHPASLFGTDVDDEDESSDEWDDDKPATTSQAHAAPPLFTAIKQPPPPPPAVPHPATSKTFSASNLFGASDSDDDDAEGGYRPCLLTSAMVDTIQGWVESDPHMTLQEVKDRVQIELGAQVSTTTLHRELDKRVFTYNDDEPVQANDVTQKRQDYVRAFRALSRQGKIPIWMGKKTFNLFSSRVTKKARAKREKRPSAGSTRGNVHVFGAISTSNFVYCEHKRGEYKYADANQSLERMLRAARAHYGRLDDIVVIADNAPWYSRIPKVFEEDEFSAATVLRLGTYSSMLNPIEHLWAEVSAHIKTLVRERLEVFMGLPPHGLTRHEFRILFLEHIVEQVLDGKQCFSFVL
ncbi:hypothetical protein DYB26_001377 [Aphanomyces astaci]|uniref:Tc1-like transposase DDE domain-containing protein n=1 Tax=Aphanomyces astaci TaxID=112090 RepID=A0A397EDC0_APHAT|nr:hypothetical protein DYB38_001111 [Aphanomyces astaci]RHZ19365.1 hypothetical protein DYB26_001377 [Aphanomyces astaci]